MADDIVDDLVKFAETTRGSEQNEAETRHKIIDTVLENILSWPKNRIAVEEYIKPGFADYVLKKSNGDDLLFVEAKKSGIYFELPLSNNPGERSAYIEIRRLQSDPGIKAAMTQVRDYCIDTGCEYVNRPGIAGGSNF